MSTAGFVFCNVTVMQAAVGPLWKVKFSAGNDPPVTVVPGQVLETPQTLATLLRVMMLFCNGVPGPITEVNEILGQRSHAPLPDTQAVPERNKDQLRKVSELPEPKLS